MLKRLRTIGFLPILAVGGAIMAALTFWLGFFDDAHFAYRENLLPKEGKQLFALVETSNSSDFHKHVPRLLNDTITAIKAQEGAETALRDAASAYGAPEGAEKMAVGLYFEDPKTVSSPRWAIGWAVHTGDDFERAKNLASEASKLSTDTIRAVRIGPGPVLAGRIPWRCMLTPMIAPMFQWDKAFALYEKEGYKTVGRSEQECAIACEVYVTGRDDSYHAIDYIVLMGDTRTVWDDTFPTNGEVTNAAQNQDVREEEA